MGIKSKHKEPGYDKKRSRYKRIKSLLNAGYPVEEIYKLCSWTNKETNVLVKEIEEDIINQKKKESTMLNPQSITGVDYWHKDDYYYHPLLYSEDDLVKLPPVYTYADLSEDEKDIYDDTNFIDGEWKAKFITTQLYKCGFYQDEKPDPSIIFYELYYKPKKGNGNKKTV